MKILIIEDDRQAVAYIRNGLAQSGPVVDHAIDGEEGFHLAMWEQYDVLVVERMLSNRDGLSIIRVLRADENLTPVLIMSSICRLSIDSVQPEA